MSSSVTGFTVMQTMAEQWIDMEKIKRVKVKDFQENEVPLVPYTEDVMGDGHETTVRNFMKLYAREYPEADEAMEDGVHSFEECWKYVTEWARKKAKNGCAALLEKSRARDPLQRLHLTPRYENALTPLNEIKMTPSARTL